VSGGVIGLRKALANSVNRLLSAPRSADPSRSTMMSLRPCPGPTCLHRGGVATMRSVAKSFTFDDKQPSRALLGSTLTNGHGALSTRFEGICACHLRRVMPLRSGAPAKTNAPMRPSSSAPANFEDKQRIGKGRGQESMKPNSRPMTLIGAHRLWSPSMIHPHLWRQGSRFLTARAASSGQIGLHAL
jgi:hypothetical protein